MVALPAPLANAINAAVRGAAVVGVLAAAARVWWQRRRGVLPTPPVTLVPGTVRRMRIMFWRVRLPEGGAFYACSEVCAEMIIERSWTPRTAEDAALASVPTRCCHCAACAELIVWPDWCSLHHETPEGCPETNGALTIWVLEAARLWLSIRKTPPTLDQLDAWAVYAAHGETDAAALIAHV